MKDEGKVRPPWEITVSWSTLLKIAVACLIGYLVVELRLLLGLLLIAFLIAVTLYPIIRWTNRRHWPKWTGVTISAIILFGIVALFFGALIPSITSQGRGLIENLPSLKDNLLQKLPQSGPVREMVDRILNSPSLSNPEPLFKHLLTWGGVAAKSLVQFGLTLIMALYFVIDGPRVYEWLLAFLPEKDRRKMNTAGQDIVSVIYSYMAGQLITSVICAVYSFASLTLLHVPDALLLAVLAGVCDVLPIIGFFISVLPALLLALTVSPTAALMVLALYVAYHAIESYFIVPRVYGNKLRLSTLTVLVAVVAAGLVGGIIGAIAILPMVASYPIIERIWLHPHLEPDIVEKHKQTDEHPPT